MKLINESDGVIMIKYNGIDYTDIYEKLYSVASYDSHSMGTSLKKYIEMKLPDILFFDAIDEICVIGRYYRESGLSGKEKNDKPFNFKRPTVTVDNKIAFLNCYPGVDYVYHYASLIKTYMGIMGFDKKISVKIPDKYLIEDEINKSNLKEVPICKTVILGYVEGFDYLSDDRDWKGTGDFQWKTIGNDKILVGCKHSYWGDISGYIVDFLAKNGVERVVYIGKLGTLNEKYKPNETIATGSKSIFIDGYSIEWHNIFDSEKSSLIKKGIHYTLPSIIQESKEWVVNNRNVIDFVDPEIGHMAKAAVNNNIQFSYLHIVSDNLVKKYDEDLSNERKKQIIRKRKRLIKTIGKCINNME